MAELTNKARVGEAFDLLAQGLEPFVSHHMQRATPEGKEWAEHFVATSRSARQEYSTTDPSFLLNVMIQAWDGVFRRQLPRSARNLLFTLRDKRNDWAHNRAIQTHDAQFTLSGVLTLLEAVDAQEVDRVRISLDELNRSLFAKEKEKVEAEGAATNVVEAPKAGLRPWRDVIRPHDDVSAGTFSVAEFAADLELVRRGEGTAEYVDPGLFFERTYLTVGLRELLSLGVKRITGQGGQPVINCQTNFGGGKTHSLIALYHLFSGVSLASLPEEIGRLVADAGVDSLPPVNRAVVVGNRFAAGEVHEKPDGTRVHTIWGEIAWQLAGSQGYELLAESDRNGTNPGDRIRDVLALAAPCLVLIDEWVAYARELYGQGAALRAGSFDSQFGFAQALTEAARGTDGALFVVSIPASERGSSPDEDALASSLEVGGVAGREALHRLTNVVARQAEQWQPAKGDESFEIVRRRLFQPIDPDLVSDRDATAEAFGELYRTQRADFPSEATEMAYVERMKTAYPIHPEVFDRLYEDWSTVDRFQRTRGVLRLMAAVIASLWESDDRSPMILPCSIPLMDNRVNAELAGKLPDYWNPVIDADVDGPNSRAWQIDRQVPALGQHHATRRVARTIFLGATPNIGHANRGLEVERIRLGATFAGEKPGFVADALNRLAAQAPYLYVDRNRYWFDRQQNVNRTARDEAARLLTGDKHEVRDEIIARLRKEPGGGDFRRVHVAPATTGDVADDPMTRLVVLGPETPHIAKAESPALEASRTLLDQRGNSPRQYRNMLVFAASDQRSLEGLEQSTADYLAWSSICGRVEELNLDAHQTAQANTRRQQSDDAVDLRLAEAYKYAIVPRQDDPVGPVTFDVVTLDQQGSVAQRASRKLVSQGNLATQFPPVMLRLKLDNELASRWEEGHVAAAQLWEDFAKYVYLPRLRDQDVLMKTIEAGPSSMVWQSEGFAVAAGIDDVSGRYLGLTAGSHPGAVTPTSLLVKPEFAIGQMETDEDAADDVETPSTTTTGGGVDGAPVDEPGPPPVRAFRGSVTLDDTRPVKHFGDINREVLEHFASQVGVDLDVELIVTARKPDGFTDHIVRTVTENARTLKFDEGAGFSEE